MGRDSKHFNRYCKQNWLFYMIIYHEGIYTTYSFWCESNSNRPSLVLMDFHVRSLYSLFWFEIKDKNNWIKLESIIIELWLSKKLSQLLFILIMNKNLII